MDHPARSSLVGRTLAHYQISEAIGAGGMGEVYRATDTKLARDIALKVLPPDMASDPDRLARFQRQARAIASLNHPNVVTVYFEAVQNAVNELLAVDPAFATTGREFYGKFLPAELVERLTDGLRKAGLDVPSKSKIRPYAR